ncbi:hypothetical protein FRC20_002983 [Serendipita sp. 405]|nr:hypothetical protein FRC18_001363 [Serendipita sp. 400]KAG8846477.1 hypothetical protein FRC20_002983 [Serendipita sp. 405]
MESITVLGAGVVGLSTALQLIERGFSVTIVAECLPEDEKSIKYTSHWAGAHHVSMASDRRQLEMDLATFETMWRMSGEPETEHLFMRLPQLELYAEPEKAGVESILNSYPSYEPISEKELPSFAKSGCKFETITIDTPNYLLHLMKTFKSKGGNVVRACVQHISQVVDGGFGLPKPDAVVVCAGIGARTLGGVEDKLVYPIRGQTILVKAPWIKFGRTCGSDDGTWTYIIPRRSGNVIVGGIKIPNDWYPHPLKEVTDDILKRGLELCPELVPESMRTETLPTVADIKPLIIEEGCGLRPARTGGIRLESVPMESREQKTIPVVFNYGHGGYGFQSSWGSAAIASDLVVASLKGVFTVAAA